jgi:hypothetical protein
MFEVCFNRCYIQKETKERKYIEFMRLFSEQKKLYKADIIETTFQFTYKKIYNKLKQRNDGSYTTLLNWQILNSFFYVLSFIPLIFNR